MGTNYDSDFETRVLDELRGINKHLENSSKHLENISVFFEEFITVINLREADEMEEEDNETQD